MLKFPLYFFRIVEIEELNNKNIDSFSSSNEVRLMYIIPTESVMCDVIKIRLKRKDERSSGKGNTIMTISISSEALKIHRRTIRQN